MTVPSEDDGACGLGSIRLRHVIEHSVLSAHRHVFGVFAWYSLLTALGLGPAGAPETTHGCPGYQMAIGVLMGMSAAIMASGTLRPSPSSTILYVVV